MLAYNLVSGELVPATPTAEKMNTGDTECAPNSIPAFPELNKWSTLWPRVQVEVL